MRSILVAMLVAGAAVLPAAQALATGAPYETLIDSAVIPPDLGLDPTDVPGGKAALLCLALNDYWEARGETKAGRIAVAKVVLNRVRDARYPSDVCSVVTENRTDQLNACQFSWHCDGRPDAPEETAAWRQSLLVAAAVLHSGDAIEDPSDGALWYHATFVRPVWADRLEVALEVGNHIFYRDPGGLQIDPRGVKRLAAFQGAGPNLPDATGTEEIAEAADDTPVAPAAVPGESAPQVAFLP